MTRRWVRKRGAGGSALTWGWHGPLARIMSLEKSISTPRTPPGWALGARRRTETEEQLDNAGQLPLVLLENGYELGRPHTP